MKTSTLVDTNILMDVFGAPNSIPGWSRSSLVRCRSEGALVINQLVWSELAPLVGEEQILENAIDDLAIDKELTPWGSAYAAGMAHSSYRRRGGLRERTLPDFLIGAHAVFSGHRLLTRDPVRYRTYFPSLYIIAPDTHP